MGGFYNEEESTAIDLRDFERYWLFQLSGAGHGDRLCGGATAVPSQATAAATDGNTEKGKESIDTYDFGTMEIQKKAFIEENQYLTGGDVAVITGRRLK